MDDKPFSFPLVYHLPKSEGARGDSPRMWEMTNKKIEERAAKLEICLYLIIKMGNGGNADHTGSGQCQVCS